MKDILTYPDKFLLKTSQEVKFKDDVNYLIDKMENVLEEHKAIGLSAIQIGIPLRVVLINLRDQAKEEDPKEIIYMINPELTIPPESEEKAIFYEGCLSIPYFYVQVARDPVCKVEYYDRDWNKQSLSCSGILSSCVQHEVDHLDGILITQRVSRLRKDMAMKKRMKYMKKEEEYKELWGMLKKLKDLQENEK